MVIVAAEEFAGRSLSTLFVFVLNVHVSAQWPAAALSRNTQMDGQNAFAQCHNKGNVNFLSRVFVCFQCTQNHWLAVLLRSALTYGCTDAAAVSVSLFNGVH